MTDAWGFLATGEARSDETPDEERIDGMEACEACDGSGTMGAENCDACDGSGAIDTGAGATADTEQVDLPEDATETHDLEPEDAEARGEAVNLPENEDTTAEKVDEIADIPAEQTWQTCPQCEGAGNVEQGSQDDGKPGDGGLDDAVCPNCNGKGEVHTTVVVDGGGKHEDADRPGHDNDVDNYNADSEPAELSDTGANANRDAATTVEVDIKVRGREELTAVSEEARAIAGFVNRYGKLGEKEIRHMTVGIPELRESGAGTDYFTVRGHAAVFNKESLDLGWFTEYIEEGAFDRVLTEDPDVRFDWDHDTRWMLARTKARNLDLKVDPIGLAYWARVNGGLSYAADLRICLEEGLIDQASFMFTVARDRWEFEYDEDGYEVAATRYIIEVGELYDVTVCAMGAYPQTDSQLARTYFFENARHIAARSELARRKIADLKSKAEETRTASAETLNPSVARVKLRAKALKLKKDVK